jgi:flagellar basal-body rod modification protein FlgD
MATVGATTSNVTAAVTTTASVNSVAKDTLASNFTTFLQLLTTQLKNQNPLDPLDTNQFTQQLVQFAQVEQQLKSNDQLATLVSMQKAAQSTEALAFVGATVALDGSQASLSKGSASWGITPAANSTVNINITNASGQTVFTKQYSMQAGATTFVWDGKGNDGVQYPDGSYKLSATAKDVSGQSVGVSTEILGTVDSVDLTQSPPLLSVGGQSYTTDKIKRVVAKGG